MPTLHSVETPKANPEKLLSIVDQGYQGKVVIPEFQRSFLWSREDIEELLVSLLQGYFIGTFLLLDTQPDRSLFPFRPIEGLKEINPSANPNNNSTVRLVLDGQQRITSLFYVLYEPPIPLRNTRNPYRFFFRPDLALDSDPTDAVIGISRADKRRMAEIEALIQTHQAIPFSIYKDSSAFYRWLYNEQQFLQDEYARKVIEGFYSRFANFMVPVIALSPETGKDNIVNIFERINRTGISLSLFDLATARLYPKGIKLRDLWQAFARGNQAVIKVIKAEFLLKVIALLQGKEPGKGALLDVIGALDTDEFRERWETATEFITKAYQRITSTAGYGTCDPKWIPYTTLIVPLAALLHWLEKQGGGEGLYRKVDRWYWTSVFKQRYDQAVDTNTYKDVKEAMKQDDFDVFIQARRLAFLEEIRRRTGQQ